MFDTFLTKLLSILCSIKLSDVWAYFVNSEWSIDKRNREVNICLSIYLLFVLDLLFILAKFWNVKGCSFSSIKPDGRYICRNVLARILWRLRLLFTMRWSKLGSLFWLLILGSLFWLLNLGCSLFWLLNWGSLFWPLNLGTLFWLLNFLDWLLSFFIIIVDVLLL
jgi:hypothetical protein